MVSIQTIAKKENMTVSSVKQIIMVAGIPKKREDGKILIRLQDWEKIKRRKKRTYFLSEAEIEQIANQIKEKYGITGSLRAFLKHRLAEYRGNRTGRKPKEGKNEN